MLIPDPSQNPSFSIPDPGFKKITDPGSASKNLSNLTQKIVSKLLDLDFLPIPDHRVKKEPDSGSRFATLISFHVKKSKT
jgi:hypothetical protein